MTRTLDISVEYSLKCQSKAHVNIRWTDIAGSPHEFPKGAFPLYPRNEAHRIRRFINEPDRRLRYASAGLISDLVAEAFGDITGLFIDRDRFDRPHISGVENADISVSHSGDIVVCALSTGVRIGIDIEQVRPVDISDFDRVFPKSLWEWLRSDGGCRSKICDDERFFHAWTQLESVIKADGRGLGVPLSELVFDGQRAHIGLETWYLSKITVADGYKCSLAGSVPIERCEVKYSRFQPANLSQ